ncbi:hypothetical protein [Microbacterium indicum]|uniref:hypothetical protein n=1 Tax=Microbacterium indicum TaxID=358100 RepID=UPI00068700C4|nr:hypothetical protein [Microbacterium indicum]
MFPAFFDTNVLYGASLNDEKDRHVLAAAVRGGAEVLVTFNLQDFPQESAAPFDIEVVHPESFPLDQLDLHRAATIQTVQRLIETYNSPTMTLDDYLLTLVRADVPEFADELRRQLY